MEENTNVNVNEEQTEQEQTENTEIKTYTAEEVAKLLQQESDRRVSQALAKQKKEYDRKLSLSKLDGVERERAEAAQKIQELQEQLAQFQIEKNKSELKSVLSSRGLSAEFADLIQITDNIEESQSRIDALDRLFKSAVKQEVEKRLASNSPKANLPSNAITEKDAKKMSLAEMQKLLETNPEQYEKYFK